MLVNPSDRLVIATTPGVDPTIFARGLGYAPSELIVDPHNSHGVLTRSWVNSCGPVQTLVILGPNSLS